MTLDDTRLPTRNGTTNQYVFGIVIESVGISMRSITFAPALDVAGPRLHRRDGEPGDAGRQLAEPAQPVDGDEPDVHRRRVLRRPPATRASTWAARHGDEFTFGGFGGSGVSVQDERPPGDRPRQRRLPLPAQRLVPAGRGRGRLRGEHVERHVGTRPAGNAEPRVHLDLPGRRRHGRARPDDPGDGDQPETVVTLAGAGVGVGRPERPRLHRGQVPAVERQPDRPARRSTAARSSSATQRATSSR